MTEATIEIYSPFLDSIEYSFFPYERRTGFFGGSCGRGLRGAYDCYPKGSIDGMGKT